MVWEVLHGLEQQVGDVCQEPHGHPGRQVLLGEVEDAGARRQLHGQVQGVVPHADHHQLQHNSLAHVSCSHICTQTPRTICLLLEATTVTHSTHFLPPLYLSEKSIWCGFNSQGITFPSAEWFKAGNFYCCKSFCTACSNLSKKRLHRLQEIPRKSQAGIKSPNPFRGQSFCSAMIMIQGLVVWWWAILNHILSCWVRTDFLQFPPELCFWLHMLIMISPNKHLIIFFLLIIDWQSLFDIDASKLKAPCSTSKRIRKIKTMCPTGASF